MLAGGMVRRMRGAELVGQRYSRPLDWLEYPEGTEHEIIVGEDFVSADDGSGVVHMSPAFGADDYAAGLRHNLAFLQPVGRARRVSGVDAARRRVVLQGCRRAADRGA